MDILPKCDKLMTKLDGYYKSGDRESMVAHMNDVIENISTIHRSLARVTTMVAGGFIYDGDNEMFYLSDQISFYLKYGMTAKEKSSQIMDRIMDLKESDDHALITQYVTRLLAEDPHVTVLGGIKVALLGVDLPIKETVNSIMEIKKKRYLRQNK